LWALRGENAESSTRSPAHGDDSESALSCTRSDCPSNWLQPLRNLERRMRCNVPYTRDRGRAYVLLGRHQSRSIRYLKSTTRKIAAERSKRCNPGTTWGKRLTRRPGRTPVGVPREHVRAPRATVALHLHSMGGLLSRPGIEAAKLGPSATSTGFSDHVQHWDHRSPTAINSQNPATFRAPRAVHRALRARW